jgi:uncharacterized protein YcfL
MRKFFIIALLALCVLACAGCQAKSAGLTIRQAMPIESTVSERPINFRVAQERVQQSAWR